MGVENEVYMLQTQADATAGTLSCMFATRADNLVNELASSYYSEVNLDAMTNALHDSLVSTLERGYNISGITSALDSIAAGADNVASAASNAADALSRMGVAQEAAQRATREAPQETAWKTPAKTTSYSGSGSSAGKYYNTNTTKLPSTVKDGSIKTYIPKYLFYASGTRNAKGGLRVINEEGVELTLPKLSSGNYTIGNEGGRPDPDKGRDGQYVQLGENRT